MVLLGSRSDFQEVWSSRPRRCGECGSKILSGDTYLASMTAKGHVKKTVCSEECRQTFDDRYWQRRADKRERSHGKDS